MGESAPPRGTAEEALRWTDGARWFWSSFAARIVLDAEVGRNPEAWGDRDWEQLREHITHANAALIRYVSSKVADDAESGGERLDPEVVKQASGLVLERLTKDGLATLEELRTKSAQVPENLRRAYWDGILDWARQQIAEEHRNPPGDGEQGVRMHVSMRPDVAPPALDRIASSIRGLDIIQKYALGPWTVASAQQGLLNLRSALAYGEFISNPQLSPYPVTDISTADIKAHAEIRPTDLDFNLAGDAELQSVMLQMAESLRRRGVIVADVSDALLYLWSRKRGPDGWAHVTLDDLCSQLGRTPRAGRKGGYEPRARDAVREAVEKVARVQMTVRHLTPGADGKPHRMQKGAAIGVTDPVVMIRNRVTVLGEPVQGELWGPLKWDSIYIQPGAYARHAIERNGAELLIRSRKLYALDDYRHRSVKLLGHRLEELFRINARTGPAIRLRVSTLLGYADIASETPRPEDRDALEGALERLVEAEVLRGWQYADGFNVDDKVRQRMTSRRLEEWADSFVEVEASQPVADQYAPIAEKALAHKHKAGQRAERAARKAAQETTPPAGIGAELRALRSRLGLSVLVAGERIGISSATVSRIENGAKVSPQAGEKVRAWLKRAG